MLNLSRRPRLEGIVTWSSFSHHSAFRIIRATSSVMRSLAERWSSSCSLSDFIHCLTFSISSLERIGISVAEAARETTVTWVTFGFRGGTFDEAIRAPGTGLVGGKRGGMDEPGVEGGKLIEFVAEIEPGRPIPTLFIAPDNLLVGMGVFALMRFAMEFVEPILILVASGKPWGRFEPLGIPPNVGGRAPAEDPGPGREECWGTWASIWVVADVEPE